MKLSKSQVEQAQENHTNGHKIKLLKISDKEKNLN